MYIDGVILFSLVIIGLILWMMGYVGLYFFRHIKTDAAAHDKECQQCANCENKCVKI